MLVFLTILACNNVQDERDSRRIAELHATLSAHEAGVSALEDRARNLSSRWQAVVASYQAAHVDFQSAERSYQAAESSYSTASPQLFRATNDFEGAALRWKIAQHLIEFAVMIDASNIGTSQQARRVDLSCERGMSTADFRRLLISQGRNLSGIDIDHIVPRSLGGADHPSNYQLLDSSLNRSLGATWNAEKCNMPGAARCAEALAVSSACGSYVGGVPRM